MAKINDQNIVFKLTNEEKVFCNTMLYSHRIVYLLEADARVFGFTKGKSDLQDLLDKYPSDIWRAIINGQMRPLTKEFLSSRYSEKATLLNSSGVLGFSP